MKKVQKFEFKNVENSLNYHVLFYKDDYGANCIYDNLCLFYHDLHYCLFSGLFLKHIGETEDYYEMEAIHNNIIDDLRYKINTSIDERLNEVMYTNFHYTKKPIVIWQQVYEIAQETYLDKPGDLHIATYQENDNLLYSKRSNKERKIDYCYLIYDTLTEHYKIGRSQNPGTRYKTLLSDRNSLELITVFQTDCQQHSIRLERKLHIYFDQYRNLGEWFDLKHLTIDEIIETYYSIADELGIDIYEDDEYESRNDSI